MLLHALDPMPSAQPAAHSELGNVHNIPLETPCVAVANRVQIKFPELLEALNVSSATIIQTAQPITK